LAYTPPDKRVILLIIGYSFGALLEGTNMRLKALSKALI
jgi:L-lactate permease